MEHDCDHDPDNDNILNPKWLCHPDVEPDHDHRLQAYTLDPDFDRDNRAPPDLDLYHRFTLERKIITLLLFNVSI